MHRANTQSVSGPAKNEKLQEQFLASRIDADWELGPVDVDGWASRPNGKKQFHATQARIDYFAPRRHMTWLPCQISILTIS